MHAAVASIALRFAPRTLLRAATLAALACCCTACQTEPRRSVVAPLPEVSAAEPGRVRASLASYPSRSRESQAVASDAGNRASPAPATDSASTPDASAATGSSGGMLAPVVLPQGAVLADRRLDAEQVRTLRSRLVTRSDLLQRGGMSLLARRRPPGPGRNMAINASHAGKLARPDLPAAQVAQPRQLPVAREEPAAMPPSRLVAANPVRPIQGPLIDQTPSTPAECPPVIGQVARSETARQPGPAPFFAQAVEPPTPTAVPAQAPAAATPAVAPESHWSAMALRSLGLLAESILGLLLHLAAFWIILRRYGPRLAALLGLDLEKIARLVPAAAPRGEVGAEQLKLLSGWRETPDAPPPEEEALLRSVFSQNLNLQAQLNELPALA